MAKKCTQCGMEKPETEFGLGSNMKPKAECKECAKARVRVSRNKKKLEVAIREKPAIDLLTERVTAILGGLDRTKSLAELSEQLIAELVGSGIAGKKAAEVAAIDLTPALTFIPDGEYLMIDDAARSYTIVSGAAIPRARERYPTYSRIIGNCYAAENLIREKMVYSFLFYTTAPAPAPTIPAPSPRAIDYALPLTEVMPEAEYTVLHSEKDPSGTLHLTYEENVLGRNILFAADTWTTGDHRVLSRATPAEILQKIKNKFTLEHRPLPERKPAEIPADPTPVYVKTRMDKYEEKLDSLPDDDWTEE